MKKFMLMLLTLTTIALVVITGCRPPELEGIVLDIRQQRFDQALENAKEAVKKYPDNPEAWYLLGFLYGKKGEFQEMSKAFDKALSIDPNKTVSVNGAEMPLKDAVERIRMQYFVENHNSGIKIYNQAIQTSDPAEKERLLKEAAQKFLNAHYAYPSRPEPLQPLALAYLQLQDTTSAEKYFVETLKYNANNDTIISMVGDFYFQIGKKDKAKEMYLKALEINPQNVNALVQLGQLEAFSGNWDAAVNYFNKALELDPENKDLAFNIALSYYKLEKYADAIPFLKKVIEAEPDNEQAYEMLGFCYIQSKQYQEAVTFLEGAVKQFPNSSYLWNYLAVAYANLGDAKKAEEANKKAQELEKQGS